MSLVIKICGLNDPACLDAALDAGADMVGFVFFARSPRHIGLETARALGQRVRGRAERVALTVDASDEELAAIVAALDPDVLQLHGNESPDRAAAVKARFGRPVIRAVAVRDAADVAGAAAYEQVADRLLFDACAPAGAARPGGNGATFDWSLLRGVATARPWLLAGGLTPDTVADALAATGAPGVDVSSGVESAPGRKDAGLIERFVRQARLAEAVP